MKKYIIYCFCHSGFCCPALFARETETETTLIDYNTGSIVSILGIELRERISMKLEFKVKI